MSIDLATLRAELSRAIDGLQNAERALAHAQTERRAAQARVDALETQVRLAHLFPDGVPLKVGQRVEVDGFAPGAICDVYLVPLPHRQPQRTDLRGIVQPDDRTVAPYAVMSKDVEQ